MAKGVNKVILIGRLGKDPETRYLSNGSGVTTFSIATSESWTDKQTGQKQERTEWHRIQAWGKLSEICSQYLKKGSQVFIEGSLTTREWEDQQGIKRYSTEIKASSMQMLDSMQSSVPPPQRRQPSNTQNAWHQSSEDAKAFYAPQNEPTQSPMGGDEWVDDIPF